MALSKQKQVMAGTEQMAGRTMGRVARSYRRAVIGPLVGEIKKAKSVEGLLAQLGPGTVRKMDTTVLREALVNTAAPAAAIGFVSATPGKTSKRRNVKTGSER